MSKSLRNPSIDCLDEHQLELYQHFAPDSRLHNPTYVFHILLWITFFRRNIHRFVMDVMEIKIYPYQMYMLYFLNTKKNACIIAARSAAKSFCIALFACARAMLYPNSLIIIASSTLGQSRLIVSQKIKVELCGKSKVLREAIKSIDDRADKTAVTFHNGSMIKVVPASENALGNRSTFLIIEEAGRTKKSIVTKVLNPFQINRQVEYMTLPYYEKNEYLRKREEPITSYISSSQVRSHWLIKDIALPYNQRMEQGQDYFLMCMDYSITLRHNIKPVSFIQEQKAQCDPMTFATEYENLAPSQSLSSYFSYSIVKQNQTLKRPFYPLKNEDFLAGIRNKYSIPKQNGEIRILSCDIAMMDRDGNDKSAYSCIRMLPDKQGVNFQEYKLQVPYLEAFRGCNPTKQAIRINQLFYDFQADYIVLDMRSYGIPVYDELAKVLYDDDRCIEYKPLYCMNEEILDNTRRSNLLNADSVIYGFVGNAKLNSSMAVNLRTYFTNNRLELLIEKNESEEEISKLVRSYNSLLPEEKVWYEKPYNETMLAVYEIVNLQYEKMENTGNIRVFEKSGNCKDRFSSIGMGCYFADILSRDLIKSKETIAIENAPMCVSHIKF